MALTKIDDRGLTTPIDLLDSEKIRFGTGNDLEIYHNGTNSFIENTTGILYLDSAANGVNVLGELQVEDVEGTTLRLGNTAAAASDGDYLSGIDFHIKDNNDATGAVSAAIRSHADQNHTATAKGTALTFHTTDDDTTTLDERMRILHNGNVGIGTGLPDNLLHLYASSTTQTANTESLLVLEKNGDSGITILSGYTSNSRILFGDSGDNDIGQIDYDHNNNSLTFVTNASPAITINSSQKVGIGTESPLNLLSLEDSAPVLSIKDTASYTAYTNGGKIYFQGTDSDGSANRTFAGVLGVSQSSNNGQLRLQTRSGGTLYDRLIINADGAVGINTATPRGDSSYQGLEISGTSGGVVTFSQNHVEKWNIYGADAVGGVYDRVNTRYNLKWHSDGDIELPTGNLKVANGKGIDFSANANATGHTSNLLDDYESGTWTATVVTGTCTAASCQYIKIGNQVTVWGRVHSFSDTSTNIILKIEGLPYACNTSNAGGNSFQAHISTEANCPYVTTDETISFYGHNTAASWSYVTHLSLSSSAYIYFYATYRSEYPGSN